MSDKPLDRHELGRQITRAANASVAEVLAGFAQTPLHSARRIGITGPPGAGKSSLITRLCRRRLAAGIRIGVIAVDPSSPFTSGAILGDRVRMEDVGEHENVFIRSLASRGAHNGLADNIPEILLTMDAYGFDEVILETVGIGQVECAVRDLVDTTVLVLNPESGDQVQAMKAGVLEAADIIVVNKSDLPGAEKIATEVTSVVKLRRRSPHDWQARILTTSRVDEPGLKALDEALSEHAAWARQHRDPRATERARRAYHLMTLLVRSGADRIARLPADAAAAPLQETFAQLIESLRADLPRQGNGK